MKSRRTLPLLVLVLTGLVYGGAWTTAVQARSKPKPEVSKQAAQPAVEVTNETLPPAVMEMREAIQTAARTGRLEELRTPIELNELKPETGAPAGSDLLAYWKSFSTDGQGLDVMAAMVAVLDAAPATLPLGADIENNRLFVWPGFATRPLSALTAEEDAELLRIAQNDGATMKASGHYAGWRLVIGADGTWHSFQKMQ
jgi:hypothetical protein